jgi:hypothetical protein
MRRLVLFALICLPALASAAPRNWAKAACEDDLDSCRESCTIAEGTDLESQGRLARCAQRCQEERERCVFKRFQARRAPAVPKPPPLPPPAQPSSGALHPAVPGVQPPVSPPAKTVREEDPWSIVRPAPPAAPPRAASDPAPRTSRPQEGTAASPPEAAQPPPHPADSVDVFLDHPGAPRTESLHVQPSSSHALPAPAKLPPPKRDLSKWDPSALE